MSEPAAQAPASVQPVPAYRDAAIMALSQRLQDARTRRRRLLEVGVATQDLDREILDLRRQLREGGQLLAGDALGDGRFLLIKPIGRGGFAVVWEAHDVSNDQTVAIKVLHSHLAGDLLRRERFFRGARAMMALSPSGVVRVLEPEHEDGGFHYFVMELVSGGNLHDAVLRGRVEQAAMLPLLLQVCDAVAEAHAKGMIHRDIKPSNILLDGQGNPKLTDFDLVGAADTTGGTRTGALGTLLYSAPECLDKPQDATPRADVYGLGMTAIFCLSGQELPRSILRTAAPTIAKLNCSSAMQTVLARAVAWDPEERFADAHAMGMALRAAMNGLDDFDWGSLAPATARALEKLLAIEDDDGPVPGGGDDQDECPSPPAGVPSVSEPATVRPVILFLAANPRGTDRLALAEEARAIERELELSLHRVRFEFRMTWAAQPLDLLLGLRKFRPTVVHFTGHGSEDGLYFQGGDGSAQLVTATALTQTFDAAGGSVRLVVLNTSYSDAQAEALRAHVDCVIGVRGAIADEAARSFATGLYTGLAEGESIAAAYRMGCAAVNLAALRGANHLVLKVRTGVDVERLVLLTEPPAAAVPHAANPDDASDA